MLISLEVVETPAPVTETAEEAPAVEADKPAEEEAATLTEAFARFRDLIDVLLKLWIEASSKSVDIELVPDIIVPQDLVPTSSTRLRMDTFSVQNHWTIDNRSTSPRPHERGLEREVMTLVTMQIHCSLLLMVYIANLHDKKITRYLEQ